MTTHVATVYKVEEVVVESIGRHTYVRPSRMILEPCYYIARCPCGWRGPHRRPIRTGYLGDETASAAARSDGVSHVDTDRFGPPDRGMTA